MTYNDEIARAKGPANLKLWKFAKEQHVNDVRLRICWNGCIFVFCLKVCLCLLCLQVILERSAYHYRIQKSIHFKESLSIVIDGSEMSRYGLPYFCQADKSTTEGCHPILCHIQKIRTVVHGTCFFFFLGLLQGGKFQPDYTEPSFTESSPLHICSQHISQGGPMLLLRSSTEL
jgi:hypothetical protein